MAKNLSQDDIDELKNAFEQYDLNKDGHISKEEFLKCMNSMGIKITDDYAKQFIKEMDSNGDGKVEWHEYLEMKIKEMEKEKNPFY